MRFDVAFDGTQPGRAYAAPFGNRGCVARRAERDGDEIAELRGDEPPHLRDGERGIVEHGIDVASQQRQHAGAARDPAKHGIVDIAHQRAQRRARQADDAMIHDVWPADGARDRIAEQHRVAIAQRRLAALPRNEAESAQIHVKAEIVVAVATVAARVLVPDALHRPGQEAEVGKLAEREVDAAGEIRHRL